ncbi:MAG: hypothetical protein RLZZ184_2313 [Cyanobacteriota bacterium]|jgi:PIN domain nuclease of toxin-antitoxin system
MCDMAKSFTPELKKILDGAGCYLLQDPDNEVIISVVSLWEMQIKIQLGKLALRDDLELMLKIQRERNNIRLISATLPHILELKTLPLHHKDPFDRMLIAQSKLLQL